MDRPADRCAASGHQRSHTAYLIWLQHRASQYKLMAPEPEAGQRMRVSRLMTSQLMVVLAALLSGGVGTAQARDYFVDVHVGSDANDGSREHPFKTLTPLLQHLHACDHAYINMQNEKQWQALGGITADGPVVNHPSCGTKIRAS